MTKTTWTFAPAGVLGQGIAAVRPYPGVVCPSPEAVRGTGLPAGAFVPEAHGLTGDTTLGIRSPGRPQS